MNVNIDYMEKMINSLNEHKLTNFLEEIKTRVKLSH